MSDSQFCQVHWRDADLVNADIDWELEDLPDDSKVSHSSHAPSLTPFWLIAGHFCVSRFTRAACPLKTIFTSSPGGLTGLNYLLIP